MTIDQQEDIIDLARQLAECAIDAYIESRREDPDVYMSFLREATVRLIVEVRGIQPSSVELDSLCNLADWDIDTRTEERLAAELSS